jgi:hypothetical protein
VEKTAYKELRNLYSQVDEYEVGGTCGANGEEGFVYIIPITGIGVLPLLVAANVVPSSPILVTLIMEGIHFSRNVGFFQDSLCVSSLKMAFLALLL